MKKKSESVNIEAAVASIENADLLEPYRFSLIAYNYHLIFFLRRYLMLCILTLAPLNELLQIFMHFGSTMCVLAYLMRVRPFKSRLMNITETLNECTVLIAAYPLLTFTEYMGLHESYP